MSGWEYRTAGRTVVADSRATWQVNCPAGKKALGGGVATNGFPTFAQVAETAPAGEATGWHVTVRNSAGPTSGITLSEFAWVICAYVA